MVAQTAVLQPSQYATSHAYPSIQFIEWRDEFKALGVELSEAGFRCSTIPLKSIRNSLSLPTREYVDAIDSDLLVTHNPYHGLMGASLAKRLGRTKTIALRLKGDYWEESRDPGLSLRQKLGSRVKMLQNRVSLDDVDFMVVVSDYLKRSAERNGVEQTVYTLPCGVDTGRFALREPEDGYRSEALCVMNFTVPKKVSLLDGFLRRYKESGLPYTITFLGDGPLRARIQRHADSLGLSSQVFFKGFVSGIEKYYSGCDVVIHPSSLDTLGMVLQEAGASGKPVVATRIGGIPEVVEHGYSGYTTNNMDEFILMMERLMESPDERTRIGLNGRTLMLEKFTWKRVADQFIDILRKEDLIG